MKNPFLVIVILLLLGIGGYFYLTSKGIVPKAPVGIGNKSGGSVFNSIKDAMSKSLSLKCVYKDEKGIETTTYIKGGFVRVMMSNAGDPNQPNNIVMKDMRMHMWSDTSKSGFVFTVPDPNKTTPYPTTKEDNTIYSPEKSASQDQESVLAQIEKYKDSCKAETVADSMFSVPTDVQFQDMEDLQKQMMQGLPKGQ